MIFASICSLDSSVIYQDNSQGATTWNWDFGDDTRNSKLQNPSHNFTSAGTFDITLTVTSLLGCEETITRTIYIIHVLSPLVSHQT